MSDSIEKIVAEMRECSIGNRHDAAMIDDWADRLDSLRQVPDGWVLVPSEPTQEMRSAGEGARLSNPTNMNPWHVWSAMIAAEPKANPAPPTSGTDGKTWINVATPQGLHPATASLVARFAAAVAEKLFSAQQKYGWDTHWQSPAWMDQCREQLVEHVAKGDPRDVAAYCAFLWHHGESTAPKATPAQAVPSGVYYNDEAGNFYSSTTRQGMGGAFFQTWFARRDDFPKSANTPAQALGEQLANMRERVESWDADCDELPKASELADWIDSLVQHFAGLEERIADLERERDTYCAQNRELREGVLPMLKRAEAAEARCAELEERLAECFRIAGGDTDSCQSSQVARAVEVVTDLRQCYQERGRELDAAEARAREADGLLDRVITQVGKTITSDLHDDIADFLAARG